MKLHSGGLLLFIAALFSTGVKSQIPVEVFAGHKKTTADIMFFRFFKNKEGQSSSWLFFNRNRASMDYNMTASSNLPQFGFTESISYNQAKWKGFAPVLVVQLLNKGVYPKAGFQFSKSHKNYSIFSWLVCETLNQPNIDWFFLGRYTPAISSKLRLFVQTEAVNSFPTNNLMPYNFIQRLRLGFKINDNQFGLGTDITTSGRNSFTSTYNIGVFLRHEF